MAQLKLQVLLAAVDKLTRPLKSIQNSATGAAKDVSNTQRHIKELNKSAGQIDGYRKVSRQVGITGNELKKLQQTYQGLGNQIKQTENPSKQLTQEFDRAKSKYQQVMRQQRQNIEVQNRHKSALTAAGINTKNLKNEQQRLTNHLSQANRALEQQKTKLASLAAQQKKLAKARQTYDNTKQLQGQLAGGGTAMVATGVAAAVPVLATIVGYSAFEGAMKGVAKQVAGARDDNGQLTATYYEMAAAIKQISEEIPQLNGALDIAALVEGGARMGVKGKEDLLSYARTAAMASKAFELPADQLGEDMGKIANLYKIPIKNISELGDAINWLDDNAQSKGSDIINVLQRLGGVADKLDYRNAAALGSTFLSLGSAAETAASASNAMVRELSIATMQSKRFQSGIKTIGMDSAKIEKAMSVDSMGTIIEVLEKIKTLPKETQLRVTTQIFSKEYGKDAAKLANNMEELRRQINLTHDAAANGSMAREAGIDADSLSGQWDLLKATTKNANAAMGETLRAPLMDIIKQLRSVASGARAWIEANPKLAGTILKVIVVISTLLIALGSVALAAAAVLGPLALVKLSMTILGVKALPGLIPMLKAVGAGFIKLGLAILTTPLGWFLLAIAAIAGAGYLIYKNWDAVSAYFVGLWVEIKAGFSGGLAGILGLIANFSPIGMFYRAFAAVLNYFGTELPATFAGFGSMIIDGLLSGITNKLGAFKDKIVGVGESAKGWFKDTLGIRSPSKVFTQYGDDTMAGLANGLAKNHDPEQQVTSMAKKLKAAGAGLTLGLAAMPAAALPAATALPNTSTTIAQIQSQEQARKTQSQAAVPAGQPQGIVQDFSVNIAPGAIVIHAAPGMDERAIAQAVQRGIEQHQRQQAARNRSRLTDLE